jgi:hypothetical protein
MFEDYYSPKFDRAERIHAAIMAAKSKRMIGWATDANMYADVIRMVANDFPPFRTAEKPNEWENGYHCVLETLHEIADELDSYARKVIIGIE